MAGVVWGSPGTGPEWGNLPVRDLLGQEWAQQPVPPGSGHLTGVPPLKSRPCALAAGLLALTPVVSNSPGSGTHSRCLMSQLRPVACGPAPGCPRNCPLRRGPLSEDPWMSSRVPFSGTHAQLHSCFRTVSLGSGLLTPETPLASSFPSSGFTPQCSKLESLFPSVPRLLQLSHL